MSISEVQRQFEKHNHQDDQLAQLASIDLGCEHKGKLFLARKVYETVAYVLGQRTQLRLVSGCHSASTRQREMPQCDLRSNTTYIESMNDELVCV